MITLPDGMGFVMLPDIKLPEGMEEDASTTEGIKQTEQRINDVCGAFFHLISAIILSGYLWYLLHLGEIIASIVGILRFDIMLTRKKDLGEE
jgi:hypothetical protein